MFRLLIVLPVSLIKVEEDRGSMQNLAEVLLVSILRNLQTELRAPQLRLSDLTSSAVFDLELNILLISVSVRGLNSLLGLSVTRILFRLTKSEIFFTAALSV